MSALTRVLLIVLVPAGLFLIGGGLVWYLSYGVASRAPSTIEVAGLSAPAELRWGTHGEVAIHAATASDGMRALGYAHGRRRSWSVVLWRQTALGRLAEWFGEPALVLDKLTRRLALAELAQATYDGLPPADRALLDAYTDGLNIALAQPDARMREEYVLFNVYPESWQPWHTLALERLFAWLAVSLPTPDAAALAQSDISAFYDADHVLRRWLCLHGFENSIAWAVRDSAGTHLFQRRVLGDSALPLFLEVMLEADDAPPVWGASLPGTPFFPAGRSEEAAWAVFLTGTVTLERVSLDSSSLSLDYKRINMRDGAEHLAAFWRTPDRILLQDVERAATSDTLWALRWPGLSAGTDFEAWQALRSGALPSFRLLRGDGLRLTRGGTWSVLGTPPVVETLPAGVFVGSTRWSRFAAELLRTQEPDRVAVRTWIADAYSTWAAQTAPPLVGAVGIPSSAAPPLRDALTYLRNWDFAYDRASIGASIFDTWMTLYRQHTGGLPAPAALDSTRLPLLKRTLEDAVDSLTQAFGSNLSQWRWELVQPDRRSFPVWSVGQAGVFDPAVQDLDRFAPLSLPGSGHPSTLAWGTSPVQAALPAPSSWEGWVRTDVWSDLMVRRRRLNPEVPFGRYLLSDRPPEPLRLTARVVTRTVTTLLPMQPPP